MFACSGDNDFDENKTSHNKVELSFQIKDFDRGTLKSSTGEASSGEEIIENLYVFLFPTTDGQSLRKYDVITSSFEGGVWEDTNNKLLLNITQAEAAKRNVYVIANYSPALKTLLDKVNTIEDLKLISLSNEMPWSATLTSPILMSGNTTHDFRSNYQLNSIALVRILAKVQLNIKLSESHQAAPISAESIAQYRYRLINFEKWTYILKPISKKNNLASMSDWTDWSDQMTSFTLNSKGKATNLTLTTYLNESDNAETSIELSLPYIDGGFLPPPEFGDETYKLQISTKIERNHWYIYDIEI